MKEKKYLTEQEIKAHLCSILLEIDSFCRNNGIHYFLAFGTLLGAIRHNGFIPWDDDIDLWMPRPDYNRFITSFKHRELSFHSPETDVEWPLNFGKVCDERFSAPDRFGNDFGLFVDIFPLDGIPSNPFQKKLFFKLIRFSERLWSSQLFTRHIKLANCKTVSLGFRITMGRLLHFFVPFRVIRNTLNYLYSYYEYSTAQEVGCISINSKTLSKDLFSEAVHGHFEGNIFPLPIGYDSCLKIYYNDYMKIPPEEDRYSHEIIVSLK